MIVPRDDRRALVGLLVLVISTGCANQADKAFEEAVPPVLREAVSLDSAITQTIPAIPPGSTVVDHYAVESEGARALGVAKTYALHARRLPNPQKPEWRYLRSRLVNLGTSAVALAEAEQRAHMAMAPYGIPSETIMGRFRIIHEFGRWEGATRARYLDALLEACAAERATLRTAVLPESHAPDYVRGDSVGVSAGWTKDSLAARVRVAMREARASR